MKLLVIGNPENRRVTGFAEAWRTVAGSPAETLSWTDVLSCERVLSSRLEGVDVVRIESPGENWEVEKLLLARGAGQARFEGTAERVTAEDALGLDEDRGRIRLQRQWFLGWEHALREIDAAVNTSGAWAPSAALMIRGLFDKHWCRAQCELAGVPVPELVDVLPGGLDDVLAAMKRTGCSRVFIKPRHGSSASGIVALRQRGSEMIATAAMERSGGAFYNTLRVREYRSPGEIRQVVDCACRQEALIERWFAKTGFAGETVDLRVVTIAGEPCHWVLRSSKGPLTNLHLGNRRGDADAFRDAMGEHWDEAMEICRTLAGGFPTMLSLGIDLMVAPSHTKFAVAEVNAFGDLLPGILDAEGRSTYERTAREIAARAPKP